MRYRRTLASAALPARVVMRVPSPAIIGGEDDAAAAPLMLLLLFLARLASSSTRSTPWRAASIWKKASHGTASHSP